MIEALAMIGSGAIGLLVGRFMPRGPRPYKPPRPIEAICGCGHNFSMHGQDGHCHDEERYFEASVTPIMSDTGKSILGWQDLIEYRPCGCQRYVGPEPMVNIYAPEISS